MSGLIPFNNTHSDLINSDFFDRSFNMLDDFFAESTPLRRGFLGHTFKVDVIDSENEYTVEAELPGIKKEEVDVTLNEGRLTISVNRKENNEESTKNYIHKERRCTIMTRNIYLSDSDTDGIKATLENGVLKISIPKIMKRDNSIKVEIE